MSGGLAEVMLRHMQAGLEHGHDGWLDDDIAFVWPWAHWLAANISGVESRITPGDGHLTLFERRVPEVHAWPAERATLSADGNP